MLKGLCAHLKALADSGPVCIVLLLQVSSPFEVAEFDIMFGDGINNLGCVFDVAKDLGVLEARVRGTACQASLHCCGSVHHQAPCLPSLLDGCCSSLTENMLPFWAV